MLTIGGLPDAAAPEPRPAPVRRTRRIVVSRADVTVTVLRRDPDTGRLRKERCRAEYVFAMRAADLMTERYPNLYRAVYVHCDFGISKRIVGGDVTVERRRKGA